MHDRDYLKSYRIYVGLKQHFSTDNKFEYTSHESMSRISIDTLLKRKDAKSFVSFTQKIHPEQYEYLLSMFLKDADMWIGKMLERPNMTYHTQRMGRMKQLEYVVDSELDEFLMLCDGSLRDILAHNDNIPQIVKGGIVSLETLAVVNKVYNFTADETMNPLWNKKRHLINNYSKLLYVNDEIFNKVEVLLQ